MAPTISHRNQFSIFCVKEGHCCEYHITSMRDGLHYTEIFLHNLWERQALAVLLFSPAPKNLSCASHMIVSL